LHFWFIYIKVSLLVLWAIYFIDANHKSISEEKQNQGSPEIKDGGFGARIQLAQEPTGVFPGSVQAGSVHKSYHYYSKEAELRSPKDCQGAFDQRHGSDRLYPG